MLKTVDAPETVPIGSATSFGSGPTQFQILSDISEASGTELAILSGWDTTSGFSAGADFTTWQSTGVLNASDTTQGGVNGSTDGWGIDSNNPSGGQIFPVDFQDFGPFDTFTSISPATFNGPPVNFATIDLIDFKSTYQIAYVVHYTANSFSASGGSVTVGAVIDASNQVVLGTNGKFIDYVEFMAVSGNGKFDLASVSTVSNTGTLHTSFNVDVIDGNGDKTSGVINITTDGTNPLDETARNDSIAGDGHANGLNGLGGNDILVGGGGNDILKGGPGDDTFRWLSGDQGTPGTPAVDAINDFHSVVADNDKLDLASLLVGDAQGPSNTAGNLASYLHSSVSSGTTTLQISTSGAFAAGDNTSVAPLPVGDIGVISERGFRHGGIEQLSDQRHAADRRSLGWCGRRPG